MSDGNPVLFRYEDYSSVYWYRPDTFIVDFMGRDATSNDFRQARARLDFHERACWELRKAGINVSCRRRIGDTKYEADAYSAPPFRLSVSRVFRPDDFPPLSGAFSSGKRHPVPVAAISFTTPAGETNHIADDYVEAFGYSARQMKDIARRALSHLADIYEEETAVGLVATIGQRAIDGSYVITSEISPLTVSSLDRDAGGPIDSMPSQVAVLPFRRVGDGLEILLVTSRRTGRWTFPKGDIGREAEVDAAANEAYEEAGAAGDILVPALGVYPGVARRGPVQIRLYAMPVDRLMETWPEGHQRQRKWIPIADVEQYINNAGQLSLVRSLVARLS